MVKNKLLTSASSGRRVQCAKCKRYSYRKVREEHGDYGPCFNTGCDGKMVPTLIRRYGVRGV